MSFVDNFSSIVNEPLPCDWEINTFGQVLNGFISGATPYRAKPEYYRGDVHWITSGELNYNLITDTEEKISYLALRETNLKLLPIGTFLMAITGLEAEGTRGRCGIVGVESTTNQSCMALFPTDKMTTLFLFYYYTLYGNKLAFNYCQGTKQQSYTAEIVKILPIITPPLPEQQAIAEVLSDMDALIQAQEALIEKKKLIKQGVMQELLTGKRRLPGFTGEWTCEALNNICSMQVGRRPRGGVTEEGDIPSLGGENIHNENGLNLSVVKKVSFDFFHDMSQGILMEGDVLINKDGANTGKVAIFENSGFPEACINEHLFLLRGNSKLDNHFLYYNLCLENNRKEISKFIASSAQPGLNRDFITHICINIPSFAEQIEISKIIHDLDKDLEIQKSLRSKYVLLKQGMMQALLTGKIRLV